MRKIVITQCNSQRLLADFHDDTCKGLHVLQEESQSLVGNIYIGRVENVVKNINAAFIEIQKGVKCYYSLNDNRSHIFLNPKNNEAVNIGDKLLVQVNREAMKTKPATVTSKLELSGKYVVVSSDVTGVGISGKLKKNSHIEDCKTALKALLKEQAFPCGFILRTNAANGTLEDVVSEATGLFTKMQELYQHARYGVFYEKVYSASPDYCRYINDIKTEQLEKVVTDQTDIYEAICAHIPSISKDKVQFYEDSMLALHKLYSLETIFSHALNKKVWLKSGGYLVIEQTEAMVVVDVNSGKQTISKTKAKQPSAMETAAFTTNMEAAKELAVQLKLRNLSGIIIVDFINMEEEAHSQELMQALKQLCKEDPITTTVVDITKLGLVEITRKKVGKSLMETIL